MATNSLKPERMRELFVYEPETGIFRWRVNAGRWGRIKAGTPAGTKEGRGHLSIRIDGLLYQAHRLAWLYMTGSWPKDQIDHINGDRTDNRFSNLRDVTNEINNQNKKRAQSNNRLGLLGVCHHQGGFRARIAVNGKSKCLGVYLTPELAHQVYLDAKRRLHHGFVA